MLFFKRLLSILLCSFFFGGCAIYHDDREFGNYYDSTKDIWHRSYIPGYTWMPEAMTLGQTVGLSGVVFFIYGVYITAPIGYVVHQVEKVTLAPAVDTVYLPLDLLNRSSYLEKEKERAEKEAEEKRKAEESQRRSEERRRLWEEEQRKKTVSK